MKIHEQLTLKNRRQLVTDAQQMKLIFLDRLENSALDFLHSSKREKSQHAF